MTKDEAFEFLDRTARGIAEMFGASCETLVQDMSDPSHPILSIYNGQVSGREVGSTADILGSTRLIDANAMTTDFVNLYATTPAGAQIKSSTFHLMGEGYNLAHLPGVRQPHPGGSDERRRRPPERFVAGGRERPSADL